MAQQGQQQTSDTTTHGAAHERVQERERRESRAAGDGTYRGPNEENIVSNVAEGASGGLITLIDATETVLSGAVHAAGRLGTTTVEEVFGLIGTIAGGISDTATAMFQGRRMPTRLDRRDRDQDTTRRRDQEREATQTREAQATGF